MKSEMASMRSTLDEHTMLLRALEHKIQIANYKALDVYIPSAFLVMKNYLLEI
ncbi:hypothetical protein [Clostridium thermarum]|uniref:hypothetical protein n=1 Tax=Clostridium thermarum TaxID=1716543 RepID=UPI0015D6667E|nr:hypothetical protein [Clostridium thermarum]